MDNKEIFKAVFHPDEKSTYTYSLPEIVNISEHTLNKDLEQHSSSYLWFASLVARLTVKRDSIIQVVKVASANTELLYRDKAAKSGEKSTENSIKAQVDTDKNLLAIKSQLAEAEAELQMCSTIKDAFYHRMNCLVALGANIRQEMKSLSVDNLKE